MLDWPPRSQTWNLMFWYWVRGGVVSACVLWVERRDGPGLSRR